MFKNRAMQVKMVKTPHTTAYEQQVAEEKKIELFRSLAKTSALYVAGMVVLIKLTDAACTKITES